MPILNLPLWLTNSLRTLRHARCTGLLAILLASLATGVSGAEPVWGRLDTGDFVIYSDANRATVEASALRYAAYRQAFAALFLRPGETVPASTFVLFRKEKDFYAAIAPGESSGRGRSRLYYSGVVDGQPLVALPLDSGVDSMENVFTFETSFVFVQLGHQETIWSRQGLGALMSTVTVKKGKCIVGGDGELGFKEYKPWPEFFGSLSESYSWMSPERLGDFTDQAWGLMHWIVFAGPGAMDRVKTLQTQPSKVPPTELIAEMMHTPPEQFTAAIKQHFKTPLELPFDEAGLRSRFVWSEAAKAEILALKSDLLVCTGHETEGNQALAEAVLMDPKRPGVLEAEARQQWRLGNKEAAVQLYRSAIEAGSRNWYGRLIVAESQLRQIQMGTVAGTEANKVRSAARENLCYVTRARPANSVAYLRLALGFKLSPEVDASAVADLTPGIASNPDGAEVQYERALLQARLGQREAGIADLRAVIANPTAAKKTEAAARLRLVQEMNPEQFKQLEVCVKAKDYTGAQKIIEAGEKDPDPVIAIGYVRLHRWLDSVVNKAIGGAAFEAGAAPKK